MAVEGLTLLLDLGIILLAATALNFVARLLNQPSLLAYIAAGIIVGPIGLGSLGLTFAGVPIGVTTTEEILILSELGVAFLLFSIGIESNFSKLAELGKIAVIGSVVQVALTAMLVFLFNNFLGILSFEQSVYLGLIMAFSSTTIVVKILSDEHEINSLHGRLMIGFLLIQDVLVILALPLLDNISDFSTSLIFPLIFNVIVLLAAAYMLNKYIYPRLFNFASQSDELMFLAGMSSVFVFIFLAQLMDFSIAVGAFVAGVTISTLPYNLEVLNRIRGVRDFLATIFFVTLGIQIAPSFLAFPLALAVALLLIVFVFKPLIYFLITLFSGYGARVGLLVGLGLAQVSEFSFIIANQGKPILEQTPGLYPFIIVLIAGSMAVTPYFMGNSSFFYNLLVKPFEKVLNKYNKRNRFNKKIQDLENLPENLSDHIVIFGGGLVGSAIAAYFKGKNPIVVVDYDSEVILKNMRKKIPAVYGTINNQEVWRTVNIDKAKIVVLAIPRPKHAFGLIKYIKKKKLKTVIFGRARYFKDALALYDSGVDFVVMPHVIGSNVFVEKISTYLESGKISDISSFQEEYLEYLKEKSKGETTNFKDQEYQGL